MKKNWDTAEGKEGRCRTTNKVIRIFKCGSCAKEYPIRKYTPKFQIIPVSENESHLWKYVSHIHILKAFWFLICSVRKHYFSLVTRVQRFTIQKEFRILGSQLWVCVALTWALPFWLQEEGVLEEQRPHVVFQGQLLLESQPEGSYLRPRAPDLLRATPMTQCCTHKRGLIEWTQHLHSYKHAMYSPLSCGSRWCRFVRGGGWRVLLLLYGQFHQLLFTDRHC